MNQQYAELLEEGRKFQDFISMLFLRAGMPLIIFGSREYQMKIGESAAGVEIKYDRRFRSTHNLYIETGEKSSSGNARFVPSGVFREDNSFLLVIGDFEGAWVLSKKQLQKLANNPRYTPIETPTSRGFLLPVEEVESTWGLTYLVGDDKK